MESEEEGESKYAEMKVKYFNDRKYQSLLQIKEDNGDTYKSKQTVLNQFMRHHDAYLESTMYRLDEAKMYLNFNSLVGVHYVMVCVLSIFSLTTCILALIALYDHHYVGFFYIILSLFIVAAIFGCGRSIYISYGINDYFKIKHNIYKIIILIFIALISIICVPIIDVFWALLKSKKWDSYYDRERFYWIWLYFLITSLPQSIIMMIVVLHDNNFYFILSLISSIMSTIFLLWLQFDPTIWRSDEDHILPSMSSNKNVGHTFIWYIIGLLMDYFTIFFIIICSFYDPTYFVLYFYLCNTSIGVILISYNVIRGNEKRHHQDGTEYDVIDKIIIMLLKCLLYILLVLFLEISCLTAVNVMYNEYKKNKIISGMDWNLLRWIVHNNDFNLCSYFNYKQKKKRLCTVNGIIIDLNLKQTETKYTVSMMKQYLLTNCKDNFKNVTIKELKNYMISPPNIKQISKSKWFYAADDISNSEVVFTLFTVALYIMSRINRFIVFPIVIAVYFSIHDPYNMTVFMVLIIQFIFMMIGLIITLMICHEIYYSFYFIPSDDVNELVRERVGYYYNAISFHELNDLITKNIPAEIVDVIVSFIRPLPMEQMIEDEKAILDDRFDHIEQHIGVHSKDLSQEQFNYSLGLLPLRYQSRFEESDKKFTDFADDHVFKCDEFKLFIYKLAEDEVMEGGS